jgi:vitamin B12 transporter
MPKHCPVTVLALLSLVIIFTWSEQVVAQVDDELTEITVQSKRIANDSPASSYATAATALRFDPLTELQSRGLAEGQSDVTVRGGLFENTGFKLGAMTISDPQTGHYVAELPLDPALMSAPTVYKSIDSAIEGFNSAVATVSYGLLRMQDGGKLSVGAGSDRLNHQTLRFAKTTENSAGNDLGVALSLARSEGSGSLEFGDHEFSRINLQLQHAGENSQSDVVFAYQDKFFGWPGAYTGFASLPEIDDTQTTLIMVNHRVNSDNGWLEVGGFYRRLVDDYDFNRATIESGAPGSFEHETTVFGLGLQGVRDVGRVSWRYGGQVAKDELVRSTDLTNANFTDRSYVTFSVVPSIETELESGNTVQWRFGATVDYSNRDSNQVSPLLGVTLRTQSAAASIDYSLEYAATSQVPGYTALGSGPSGLFGGNAFLGREKAKQLSASIFRRADDWTLSATLFSRYDDNLVDWTYSTLSPFSRQANAVDIDVVGFEAFIIRNWDAVDLAIGFTVFDKDADYGSAQVDASFYALNFAKQRATLALTYRFAESFELRLDNEYRSQEDNPLRVGDDSAYLASLSLLWISPGERNIGVAFVVDNATDSTYQPFPGTPASGRQVSLSVSHGW